MEEYKPFRKDRVRKQGGQVALYGREQLEHMKLCLGLDKEPTLGLGLKRGQEKVTYRGCLL